MYHKTRTMNLYYISYYTYLVKNIIIVSWERTYIIYFQTKGFFLMELNIDLLYYYYIILSVTLLYIVQNLNRNHHIIIIIIFERTVSETGTCV